jgi:DNA-binding CsgD family transcriptional regulator
MSGLFGRERELADLDDLVDRAAQGGGATLIVGEAGIGKSSLLDHAAHRSEGRGHQVLRATGVPSEAHLPFAGLHNLLRPVLAQADRLPDGQRGALLSALGIEDASAPDSFLTALAVLNLLADAASDRPILLAVDDAQWLDGPSHQAVAFVARRVERDPIVVIGTWRTGHVGPLASAGLRELAVSRLDGSASRDLLAAHAPTLGSADLSLILREAEGNPLALIELPAALRAQETLDAELLPSFLPLSARLEHAFAGRFGELPQRVRDVLLVAAIDHESEVPEILAGASELSGERATLDLLDTAAEAGLVHFDLATVHFRHPLVRSAVVQSESFGRRLAANAALATVLDDQPYRRTWHRAHAIVGRDDEVADELESSHAFALRRGSVVSAIQALERSAQLTTDSAARGRRLLLAAEHAFGLGRADMVDRLLDTAAQTALGDLDRARMEWLREIFNDGVPGDAARVLALCDMARRSAAEGDGDLALHLLLGASLRCWWADTGDAARAAVAAAVDELRGLETDPRYVATLGTAEPVGRASQVTEILSGLVLETVSDANALRLYGQAAHAIGDPVRSVDFLERSEAKMRELGALGLLSQVLTMQVLDRLELGDWERAASEVDEGRQLAQETGQPIWDAGSLSLGAILAGLTGANERAQGLASRAEQTIRGRGLNDLLACVQLARGVAWISAGRHAEAFAALRPMFDPSAESFHLTERFHAVTFLAEAAVHAGRQEEALPVIAELSEVSEVTPAPTLKVHLGYARAVLAEDEVAEELYLDALRGDLTRWPWAKARLELAYGAWLRRQRRVAESRIPLRSAHATLALMGAPTWATRARVELRAAGEAIAGQDPGTLSRLSAQELQIARLAAEGLSNRDIGERLFLSPRTVGSHLYRLFPKLDVTSRSQLAARLGSP